MHAQGQWTLRTRHPGTHHWEVKKRGKNVVTVYGLNAFASALGGSYVPPQYLALNGGPKCLLQFGWSAGQTNVSVSGGQPTLAGDTQLVVGFGLSTQETVNFSSVTYSGGAYNYSISPLVYSHLGNEIVVRAVTVTDTASTITTPITSDPVNASGLWPTTAGSYSSGAGQYTVQFYFLAGTCTSYIADAGLIDNASIIGAGNLHNHFTVAYDNTLSPSDIEIDSVITFLNG